MATRLLAACSALAFFRAAVAQDGVQYCQACAGANITGVNSPCWTGGESRAGSCVWCADLDTVAYGSCDFLDKSSQNLGCGTGETPITSVAACPALPPHITVATVNAYCWLPALGGGAGVLALLVLGLLLYTRVEGLQGAPPASSAAPPAALHLLLAAAVLQWSALGLLVACPSLPWLFYQPRDVDPAQPVAFAVTGFGGLYCMYLEENGKPALAPTSFPSSCFFPSLPAISQA
jgi:hypothetical protein